MDEQTCKMQGKSRYKACCGKFKRLGDEIQTVCIADDGYTWDFIVATSLLTKHYWQMDFMPCTVISSACLGT